MGVPVGRKTNASRGRIWVATLILLAIVLAAANGCQEKAEEPKKDDGAVSRSPRLGLWLAKKGELIAHESAAYDLVMSAWFEPSEAAAILDRHPSALLLAGLTLCWVSSDPDWQALLVTVANGGDPDGPLQITDDMFLMYDDNHDGVLDRRCSFPGWTNPTIYAMDPRHTGWQELILSFYNVVAAQPQHDGVIVDMIDAHPFCDSTWSAGVPVPLDSAAWVSGQEQLLARLRDSIPDKYIIGNAGCDFPEGSPFPQYLTGYLVENALGAQCGLGVEQLLSSGERALATTRAPHIVVYAVDTDDTGTINWPRFRTGLVASLLMDHSYFAFDYGPRDHGGVDGYWFPQYYGVALGKPLAPYSTVGGGYVRNFTGGLVALAITAPVTLTLSASHVDVATGDVGTNFEVPVGDARILLREE